MLGHVLLGARLVGRHPSRLAEHERIATELERLGDSLPSLALKVSGIAGRGGVHRDRGELGPWLALEERAIDLLGDLNLPFFQLGGLVSTSTVDYLHGDFDRAEEVVAAMTPLAVAIRHPPLVWWGPIVYANRRMQARDAELVPAIEPLAGTGRRGRSVPLRLRRGAGSRRAPGRSTARARSFPGRRLPGPSER